MAKWEERTMTVISFLFLLAIIGGYVLISKMDVWGLR